MPVVCALIPRFQLISALGEAREALRGAVAVAPQPGDSQLIGEVSRPAEGLGLRAGMRLGEALARCPELKLVAADPDRAGRAWDRAVGLLEGIGAEVESARAGEAFFEARGLHGLWGGIEGVLRQAGLELGPSALLGAGPGRFCAYAATAPIGDQRRERPTIVADGDARRFLAPLPVRLLHGRLMPSAGSHPGRRQSSSANDYRPRWAGGDDLPNQFEQLGIRTLGRLASLPRDAVADRFGPSGLRALGLALGEDEPLRPRPRAESVAVELELPEAVSGQQLGHALELLIARLLADRRRAGRTIRALRLSARLVTGGGWSREVALRRAGAQPEVLAAALVPQLAYLPAPAAVLRLEARALGSVAADQLSIADPTEQRRGRLSEAVRQVRAASGPDAVLRVLEVDPDSRLPERRAVLMPYPAEDA